MSMIKFFQNTLRRLRHLGNTSGIIKSKIKEEKEEEE